MSKIRANFISSKNDNKAVEFTKGIVVGGAVTATNFDFNAEIYNVGTGASIGNPATNSLAFGTNGAERVRIDAQGAIIGCGLQNNNDGRNLKGLILKSPAGVSFQNFGANGSRNWRIRPDDLSDWGHLDFLMSPTANSDTDWPDSASDIVLTLNNDKDVVVRNGNLKINTAGKGIDFSVTGDGTGSATSEVLDDYEEGEFTPTLVGVGNGNALTLDTNTDALRYIKIGKQVTIFGRIRILSVNGATGQLRLGGFPYTSDNTGTDQSNYNALPVLLHGFSLPANSNGVVFAEMSGNLTTAFIYCIRDNDSWTNLFASNVNTTPGAYLYVTGSYVSV